MGPVLAFRAFPVPAFLAGLSGILLALSFPKADFGWLAWVALAPLFLVLAQAKSPVEGFGLGGLAGFAFFFVVLYWVFLTCLYGGVALPLAFLAWAGLAGMLALFWAGFGWAAVRLQGALPDKTVPWAWAALWVAAEWLRGRWIVEFPWALLGYSQWRYLDVVQVASITGVYGVSFLVAAGNGCLAYLLVQAKRDVLSALFQFGIFAMVLGSVLLSGHAVIQDDRGMQEKVRVAFLQPNIDQYRKWDAAFEGEVRATLEDQVRAASEERAALILWPEASVPGWLDLPENFRWVSRLAASSDAHHIVGALLRDTRGKSYNAAVLLGPEGRPLQSYYKRRLVPFGEYVPMGWLLRGVVPVLGFMGEFARGPRLQKPFDTPLGPVGLSVCYESIFPHWMALNTRLGSRVLVNLTNDGWYKDTSAPYQHFAMNVLRAVENRSYLLRAANTGISAVVDATGRVLAQTELMKEEVLVEEVPIAAFRISVPSFYARYGDLFAGLCLAASFGMGLWAKLHV